MSDPEWIMCAACECTYGRPQPNCDDPECGGIQT